MLCPDEVISQCLFGNKYKLKALVTNKKGVRP